MAQLARDAHALGFHGRVLAAFRAYEAKLGWEVARWQRNYSRLSEAHKALLPHEPAKHRQAQRCMCANQLVIKCVRFHATCKLSHSFRLSMQNEASF